MRSSGLKDLPRRTATAVVYGAVIIAAAYGPWQWPTAVFGAIGLIALVELWGLRRAGWIAAVETAVVVVGTISLIYLGWIGMVGPESGGRQWWPLLALAVLPTWAADIAAYAVGSTWGRHHLAPALSPRKTWEGTAAGFVAAGVAVALVGWAMSLHAYPIWLVVLALLVGPFALLGDLLESAVKRRARAKDSGRLLPGHGGMLDRIDGLLAVGLLVAVMFIQLSGGTLVGNQ